MPVRNEVVHLDATIDAILAQDYQGPLEVVIADGQSTDGTRGRLDERAALDPRITVVDNPAGNAAAGLNVAISAATGEVLVRCDGHAELPPEYVRIAVALLEETGAANVGGIQDATGTGLVQRAIAMAMTSILGVGNSRFHYSSKPGPVDTVYLGAFRREPLDQVGGFDKALIRNQDYDLNHRLRQAGHVVWFDPVLRVTYRPRSSLLALASQYFGYGTWKRVMLRRSPEALKVRQLAPPLLVIGLVASAIAITLRAFGLGSIVPVAYAAFLVLGATVELVYRRDGAALLLPIVLVVMHVSWGAGFLAGRQPPIRQSR